MSIGNRIRAVRKKMGLNQTDFGRAIGLKQTSLAQIETGVRTATDRTIILICEKYNVNKIWLMFGESDFARRVFKLFGRLSSEEWNKLEEIARSLVEDEKKDPQH